MAHEYDEGSVFSSAGFDPRLLGSIFLTEHAYASQKEDESGVKAACMSNNLNVATDLLMNEANRTGPGRGAFALAARKGSVPMLKLFLDWQEDAYARGLVCPVAMTKTEYHEIMVSRPRVYPKLSHGCTVKSLNSSLVTVFCARRGHMYADKWSPELDQCDKMLLQHIKAHAMDNKSTRLESLPALCYRGEGDIVKLILDTMILSRCKVLFDECCREAAAGDSRDVMAMLIADCGGMPCQWTGVVAAECNSYNVLSFLLDRGFVLPECIFWRVAKNTECEKLVYKAQENGQVDAPRRE